MEGDFWFFFVFYSLWLVCYKYTFHVSRWHSNVKHSNINIHSIKVQTLGAL